MFRATTNPASPSVEVKLFLNTLSAEGIKGCENLTLLVDALIFRLKETIDQPELNELEEQVDLYNRLVERDRLYTPERNVAHIEFMEKSGDRLAEFKAKSNAVALVLESAKKKEALSDEQLAVLKARKETIKGVNGAPSRTALMIDKIIALSVNTPKNTIQDATDEKKESTFKI